MIICTTAVARSVGHRHSYGRVTSRGGRRAGGACGMCCGIVKQRGLRRWSLERCIILAQSRSLLLVLLLYVLLISSMWWLR